MVASSLTLLLPLAILATLGALLPAEAAAPKSSALGLTCDDEDRPTALDGPLDLVLGTCTGIRPGAQTSNCTMSWILRNGTTFYATIAGHCGGVGSNVRLANGTVIGTMIYSRATPIGEDFGVFRINANVAHLVNPKLCGWGGPTGVWTGGTIPAVDGVPIVRHFGFGLGIGTVPSTRARTGVFAYENSAAFAFESIVAPGDSGSPIRVATGEALGVITDLLAVRTPPDPILPSDPVLIPQLALGTRLDHGLAAATAATGIGFELVTAPLDNEVPWP